MICLKRDGDLRSLQESEREVIIEAYGLLELGISIVNVGSEERGAGLSSIVCLMQSFD